jgi:hypothetical protein
MPERMSDEAIAKAADDLDCDVAAVRAVIDVESRGGFLDDGRPKILFERHYFSRLTGGKFDARASDISSPKPGGYRGGAQEWTRFDRACGLDRDAAVKSASWGAFQIMGSNYQAAGFNKVADFYDAMCKSEDLHLNAFVSFVKSNQLEDELRGRDWVGFARKYNGPQFKKNNYDTKLATASARFTVGPLPNLQVRAAQLFLIYLRYSPGGVDGWFGQSTQKALLKFQSDKGMPPSGRLDDVTFEALKSAAAG